MTRDRSLMGRRGLRRFLKLPRSPEQIRAEVAEELRFDLEMHARDLVDRGLDRDAAMARATADFGDLDATRRYCEDLDMEFEAATRRSNILRDLTSDVRIAWRTMRRTPGFAFTVLATLALGIGANTAVFSVVKRVLIAPLPFRASEQLYRLYTTPATTDGDDDKFSAAELTDLAAESRAVAGLTLFGNYGSLTYTNDQVSASWRSVAISSNFFDVLGLRLARGRGFTADDFAVGAPRAVIISSALWKQTFGSDERIIGRRIDVGDVSRVIVGVLPPSFVGPTFAADVLVPLNIPSLLAMPRNARVRVWRAVVRLREGVSAAAFEKEAAMLRPRMQSRYPTITNVGIFLPVPLHEAIVGSAGTVLRLVMVGALLVLAVTCVNIAGLFLSRATARRRELGVRAALGAGRARLVRHVLTETGLYGLAGGAIGIGLAFVLKGVFLRVAGSSLPDLGPVTIDVGVLVFAAAISIACGVAFGLVPAFAATRIDLRDALGDGGARGSSQGRAGLRGTNVVVAAQLSLAVVLLVAAGLLVRTFGTLLRTDVGYTKEANVLTFSAYAPRSRYVTLQASEDYYAALQQRVRALPGVTHIGSTLVAPWQGGWQHVGFRVEGQPVDESSVPQIAYGTASPDYFPAAGIPLRSGRLFSDLDRPGSTPVAIISESVARRFWPNGNSIGAGVRLVGAPFDSTTVLRIVGVVGDVRDDVQSPLSPMVYSANAQTLGSAGAFVVRSSGDARALATSIAQVMHGLDPKVPPPKVRTMHDVVTATIGRQRLAMGLIAAFAFLALLLAGLGVYSVMAYAVLARTREFGIRVALGARRMSIVVLILRQGGATIVVGAGCGLLLALALSRFVRALLVGVSVHDPMTFAMAGVLLTIVGVTACLVPARSATRVQPADALRVD